MFIRSIVDGCVDWCQRRVVIISAKNILYRLFGDGTGCISGARCLGVGPPGARQRVYFPGSCRALPRARPPRRQHHFSGFPSGPAGGGRDLRHRVGGIPASFLSPMLSLVKRRRSCAHFILGDLFSVMDGRSVFTHPSRAHGRRRHACRSVPAHTPPSTPSTETPLPSRAVPSSSPPLSRASFDEQKNFK